MNKTILKILYDVLIILLFTMTVIAIFTEQTEIALLGLILLDMKLRDRKEKVKEYENSKND